MLRVVYLDHSSALSGAELALLRLLPHVPGVDPLVILAEDGPLAPRLREAGVAVEVLPLAPRTNAVRRAALDGRRLPWRAALDVGRYVLALRSRLRELRPDLVHTNSNKSHVYGGLAARLAGVPHVWHARDRVAEEFMPSLAVRTMQLGARWLPAAVIANSEATLATLPGAPRPPGGGEMLRDPVLPEQYPQVTAAERDPLVVGLVGRLTPWKGQDLFLRAFARAFGDAPGVRARIVGSAMFGEEEYAASLPVLVAELGLSDRVDLVGFVEDVPGVLVGLDVLAHTSVIPEPFGQVVVEGMAAGLPVVASGEGGPAEVITDGVDGLLFTPRDEVSLAAALARAVGDVGLRARLGAAARERSLDFAPGPLGEDLARVYRSVVAR